MEVPMSLENRERKREGRIEQAKKVLEFLRHNWDSVLTIIVAIIAGIIRIFGIGDDRTTIGFILAIFSLLAANILRNRWINEKTQQTLINIESHIPSITNVENNLPEIKQISQYLPAIKNKLVNEEKLTLYAKQEEAENYLNSYIDRNPVREATIIQYSISSSLIKKLLAKDAKVTIFMQHEETAKQIGSELQAFYIENAYNNLKVIPKPLEEYPLTVYKYMPPCSLAGIRLDDQLFSLGWYTYQYATKFMLPPKYENDTVQVFGSERATILVQKGHGIFNDLEKTFRELEENYKRSGNAQLVFPATQHTSKETPLQNRPIRAFLRLRHRE